MTSSGPAPTSAPDGGDSPQVPTTMRTSVLRAAGDLALEHRPVPQPGSGEVLVRVASVGVCGSDVHYFRHGRIAHFVVEQPLVLGHEASGTVVAVGEGVPADRVGQRVSLEPGVPCRRCRQCRRGAYNLCPDVEFFATPPVDGVFCEYVAHPADFAHPVPREMSEDAAALLEPLSVAVWACAKAGVTAGSELLVAGAGPVGLLVARTALALGAARVLVSDVDAHRRDLAASWAGATALDPADGAPADAGVEVDAFIDCSGAAPAVAAGVPAVRPGGAVVLVGMGADTAELPVSTIQNRELTLTGTFRYAGTWPAAIALATTGGIDLDALVTARLGLNDVRRALDPPADARHVKIVVRPGD